MDTEISAIDKLIETYGHYIFTAKNEQAMEGLISRAEEEVKKLREENAEMRKELEKRPA